MEGEFVARRVKVENPEDENEGDERFVCFTLGDTDDFGLTCTGIEITQFGVIVGMADSSSGGNTLYPWNRVLWVDDMEWRRMVPVTSNGDGGQG